MAFDLWEIIAPKIEKGLEESIIGEEAIAQMELEYVEQVKASVVTVNDLKTILMAILRYNDGRRFMDASEAPLPQSEGETGFRKPDDPSGKFMLRYEELSGLRLHFESFYLTRLQLIGIKIEN